MHNEEGVENGCTREKEERATGSKMEGHEESSGLRAGEEMISTMWKGRLQPHWQHKMMGNARRKEDILRS